MKVVLYTPERLECALEVERLDERFQVSGGYLYTPELQRREERSLMRFLAGKDDAAFIVRLRTKRDDSK